MGVPGHDERDFAFAKKYGLPIVPGDRRRRPAVLDRRLAGLVRGARPLREFRRLRRPRLRGRRPTRSRATSRRRASAASRSSGACATGASPASATGAARSRSSIARPAATCRCRTTSCRCGCPRTSCRTAPATRSAKSQAFLDVPLPEVRRRRAARDRHDGHLRGLVLVLLPLRLGGQRRGDGGRAREVLDAGRPVHRRHRARDPAPAVFALLDARHARLRADGRRRAVPAPADAGHGPERDLVPQARVGAHRLLQSRGSRGVRARARRARGVLQVRRPAGRVRRHRHDVEVAQERRRSAGAGGPLRRRHGAALHDVERAARAHASSGRTRAWRARSAS